MSTADTVQVDGDEEPLHTKELKENFDIGIQNPKSVYYRVGVPTNTENEAPDLTAELQENQHFEYVRLQEPESIYSTSKNFRITSRCCRLALAALCLSIVVALLVVLISVWILSPAKGLSKLPKLTTTGTTNQSQLWTTMITNLSPLMTSISSSSQRTSTNQSPLTTTTNTPLLTTTSMGNRIQISAGRWSTRINMSNLIFPPQATTFSTIASSLTKCIELLALHVNWCCTIYNKLTQNCTVALTDRFKLVPDTSSPIEVGIDSAFTECGSNPESALPNALPPSLEIFYSRRNGSTSSIALQCANSSIYAAALTYNFTCLNGQWKVANYTVCGGGSKIFTDSGQFIVPANVTSVKVVAIGGGGGGANGHMPGGGGGYVRCGTFQVTSGSIIPIRVGTGGSGALTTTYSSNSIVGNSAGTASEFGTMLTASGGGTFNGYYTDRGNGLGVAGGSGSGCACWGSSCYSTCGRGGSGGSDGYAVSPCYTGGTGQGSIGYAACLQMATLHILTAGSGGYGGSNQGYSSCYGYGPSGGGGGIKVDYYGPRAENGLAYEYYGYGGEGYGAGGGGGGYSNYGSSYRYAGGKGANGLVYIEWK